MSSLKERADQITAEFQKNQDWESRYKLIIAMGKELPDLDDSLRTEEAKVKGCQSQVWLHAKKNSDGKIIFQGDSDALLVKGLVALLLKIYSGSTAQEILTTPPDFLKAIGFEGNLSPSRANGLFSMLKQIRFLPWLSPAKAETADESLVLNANYIVTWTRWVSS